MATLTLTKCARLQDRIRAAVRGLQLSRHVTLGVFASEPEAAVELEAARLREDLDVLERLLSILASVRATTGRANAERGITQLLAEKAAIEEELGLYAKLIPAEAAATSLGDLLSGSARQAPLRRHAGELEAQVRAMRMRYEHAEATEDTVDAPLLDDADAERLRARVVARRRRLEEIGDRLRELNGSVLVEIDDAALAYLREKEVV